MKRSRTAVCPLLTDVASSSSSSSSNNTYIDNGDCTYVCEYCHAKFWFDERVVSLSTRNSVRYNKCCKGGRVHLLFPNDPPSEIKNLFEQSAFLDNIRLYNSIFSMTSFGATINDSINDGSAPYVFRIEGQIHHWLGTICPPVGETPRFLQMYIYDTDNELRNRLRFFPDVQRANVHETFVASLIHVLDNNNELIKLFRSARDLCHTVDVPNFFIQLHTSYKKICYDTPVNDCIGAIVCDNDSISHEFDIVVHHNNAGPQRVSESGWSPALRLHVPADEHEKRLTINMFYSYQLHDRLNTYTLLLRAGRLFQQYLVDAYVCVKQERLTYFRQNQNQLRCEHLRGIHDAVGRGDNDEHSIGKRIILPSTFVGGPRYMYKHYHDALAICRVHGNPQYFITFTCNVKWPEITRYISQYPSLKAQDRPEIVVRVFKMKVDSLVDFLKVEQPFGPVVAEYTIEFQKRGLPHFHLLLWVHEKHRIRDAEELDNYISAEIPDPAGDPLLHKVVTELMMHGPCGIVKPHARCMSTGVCSKKFPKPYRKTTIFDKKGYVHYKRPLSGRSVIKNDVPLNNAFVVPYNKTLARRFRAHINVEYCGWNMMIKYLFKYISKGVDRICFRISKTTDSSSTTQQTPTTTIDEITDFTDARFICPHEAAWRLLNFGIHALHPAVQVPAVHEEEMQKLYFKNNEHLDRLLRNQFCKRTTLTEWLHNNAVDPAGRHLRYVDYLTQYRWDCGSKHWIPRSNNRRTNNEERTIGRLAYVHPGSGELFYLRLLLFHQRGCESFVDIKMVSGQIQPTYRAACEKLGLLGDDKEWQFAFTEAAAWATPSELRSLFTHMLLLCDVSDPIEFWESQWRTMGDDIQQTYQLMNEDDIRDYVLYEIQLLFNSGVTNTSLSDFGLPLP
uniref:uncharacterized protein LOC122610362 n=1 Tax=Erigeron canadensis TaxID=72917 RepID=UPI001CB983BD|nr:uncharacterized protein LOC122610362 [Erigeron canadensis]